MEVLAISKPKMMTPHDGSINLTCRTNADTLRTIFVEFNALRQTETLCDVKIVVGDRIFPCHRVILSSSCEYFKAMFRDSSFGESQKENVELRDIESHVFEQILNFIYTGEVCITDENLSSLFMTSEYLGLRHLEDLCATCLEEHVPLTNIGDLYRFALKTDRASLIDTLCSYIALNFVNLSKSNELIDVSADGLTRILTCPDLQSSSSVTTRFLLKWIDGRKDKESTEDAVLANLLKMITGNRQAQEFIPEPKSNFAFKNVNQSNESLLRLITVECKSEKLPIYSSFLKKKKFNQYRRGAMHGIKPSIKMMGECRSLFPNMGEISQINLRSTVLNKDILYLFYMINDKMHPFLWTKGPSITGEKLGGPPSMMKNSVSQVFSLTTVQRKIYFSTLERALAFYDCDTDSWFSREIENMIPVYYPSLVSRDDNIYVIGGRRKLENAIPEGDSGGLLQHLDPRTGVVNRLPNSLYEHRFAAACVYNDRIYVTGGTNMCYYNKVVEVFEPVANKWRALAPMPVSRMLHTLVPYNKHLYAIGGQKKRSPYSYDINASVYEVEMDSWLETISVPTQSSDSYRIVGILDAIVF